MKMYVHVIGELLVMGAFGAYFYRRCNQLEERIAQLEQEHMYMIRAINPQLFKQKQPQKQPNVQLSVPQQQEEEIIPDELDEIIDEELGEECEEGVCKIK